MPAGPDIPDNAFPCTEWTMVLAAGSDATIAGPALEKLCRKYWPPLYGFARRNGLSREAAEDAVQGFILTVLDRGSLSGVERDGARFRSWMLGGFTNHLVSMRRSEYAVKRGGGVLPLALDAIEYAERLLPPAEGLDPAEAFDQNWARVVLLSAINRLRAEQEASGKAEIYAAIEPVVTGQARTSYADLAGQTGIPEKNLAVMVHRLRHRLRDILRSEVAQTVNSEESLEDELRYLMDLVRRA